ncbi:hypothetical protein HYH03_003945 [Edaphochlamys debaryana]|uniref:SWIM-type domain-containing protein n=1 Tax=Edaphochlamys debaryana TaxID=47281 RepID=A0A836C2M7_9CHLO|nr:hypothetical protein HYH03_003945 [Edaphochlamys debaryana]|eukprot:KAG2498191.1 hypothetical protein HYH03_003945 [Edaphochlamys debaryana]
MSGYDPDAAATAVSITRAGDACFAELEELVEGNPGTDIPDDILASLHLLFGKNLAKALEVVDAGGITAHVGERSGRTVYKVPGRGDVYTVFPSHYCSCQSFMYDIVGRGEAVYCKHQLAVRLASVLRRVARAPCSDQDLARRLLGEGGVG